MKDKKTDSSTDDLSLLKVEKRKIIEQKPPNERIVSFLLDDDIEE